MSDPRILNSKLDLWCQKCQPSTDCKTSISWYQIFGLINLTQNVGVASVCVYGDEVLNNVGHQQMEDMRCDVWEKFLEIFSKPLFHRLWDCYVLVLVGAIAISLLGNTIDRDEKCNWSDGTNIKTKSGEIISKPLRVWRWCETVMVARVGTTTADCAGDPIGTPESPQSAAERRTANKCCQTPTKQDFSPELKTRFLAVRQKDFLWQRHTYLGKRQFLGVRRRWWWWWGRRRRWSCLLPPRRLWAGTSAAAGTACET